MSVWLLGVLVAVVFFSLNVMVRRRGDERRYNRVAVLGAIIVIVIAWGLFAAAQLGFIPNHAP